ncbi:tRNA (adenosine(37)-N6)-threonylcarbamoyltransferase complex transferase subunit TsaD [Candidatus Peregrinibacteria bacterium]|nr:tRNA (adenosine(37)-N6)-threonylcarbamoyltransferase complex transferase subunit TsaD [Candidatus Peregrinibacteria bacterium]
MKIFGIETSCDETAAAVVEDGVKVLSNVIASSVDMHQATGGVVPEVAAREHLRQISPVIDKALADAGLEWKDIDAIAITTNPGLIASLLVGINTAQTIAYIHQKPLMEVDHIVGHVYANFLERKHPPQFPLLVLTVSGGHNELMLMKGHHQFERLGETLDDAAGEAFDKVARLLGLGYPGGPAVSKMAEKGNPTRFSFPRPMLDKENKYNFSFSGLKSAVRREVENLKKTDDQTIADLCASFQQAVIGTLIDKLVLAVQEHEVKEVHLAGGVSANQLLRKMAREKLPDKLPVYWPVEQIFCTDNAAMIAAATHFQS